MVYMTFVWNQRNLIVITTIYNSLGSCYLILQSYHWFPYTLSKNENYKIILIFKRYLHILELFHISTFNQHKSQKKIRISISYVYFYSASLHNSLSIGDSSQVLILLATSTTTPVRHSAWHKYHLVNSLTCPPWPHNEQNITELWIDWSQITKNSCYGIAIMETQGNLLFWFPYSFFSVKCNCIMMIMYFLTLSNIILTLGIINNTTLILEMMRSSDSLLNGFSI
jgi:hypothetical protein